MHKCRNTHPKQHTHQIHQNKDILLYIPTTPSQIPNIPFQVQNTPSQIPNIWNVDLHCFVGKQFPGPKMCLLEKMKNTMYTQKGGGHVRITKDTKIKIHNCIYQTYQHTIPNTKYTVSTPNKWQIQGMLKRRGDMCGSRSSQRAGMQSLVGHTSLVCLIEPTKAWYRCTLHSPHSCIGDANICQYRGCRAGM